MGGLGETDVTPRAEHGGKKGTSIIYIGATQSETLSKSQETAVVLLYRERRIRDAEEASGEPPANDWLMSILG